jgi:hypothetical protein
VKNPNDPIGNQTCDLSTCSSVPQPTAPTHTPSYVGKNYNYLNVTLLVGGRTFLWDMSTHTIMVLVLIICVFTIAGV